MAATKQLFIMAQSNIEYNVREIPSSRQNHTVDPAISWKDWIDLFHLTVIANENVDCKNLFNPKKRHHSHPPVLEDATKNKSEN